MNAHAVTDLPVVDFVRPVPGFPGCRRFALVELDHTGLLCQLRSLDDPDLRFLVAPPAEFFPDYVPSVGDDVVADLGASRVEDVMALLVLKAGASLDTTTANLLAPVLLDTRTGRAAQVILDDTDLGVAVPLVGPEHAAVAPATA